MMFAGLQRPSNPDRVIRHYRRLFWLRIPRGLARFPRASQLSGAPDRVGRDSKNGAVVSQKVTSSSDFVALTHLFLARINAARMARICGHGDQFG